MAPELSGSPAPTQLPAPEDAASGGGCFKNYRNRRFERCDYIVKSSLAICMGQLGKGPLIDNSKATAESIAVVAKPI